MLKAVLFDLDNTLILFNEVKFVSAYFPLIAEKFADVLPAGRFAEKLLQATLELHKNDGSRINREAFIKAFCNDIPLSAEEIWRRFEKFYMDDFDTFKEMVAAPECAHNVFNHIREKGLKIVIATNPIWPLVAQMKRLSWVGLDEFEIALVTNIDNMTFCKPQLGYYREICSLIGEKPEDCLMVGDDPANDMVAAKIGMKTYLTVDSLDHAEKPLEFSKQVIGNNTEGIPPADFEGPLACAVEAIDTLLA
jgi:FMN phosphatase YigB (HAD superfamily)